MTGIDIFALILGLVAPGGIFLVLYAVIEKPEWTQRYRHKPDYDLIRKLEHDLSLVAPGGHDNDCTTCVIHRSNEQRQAVRAKHEALMRPALAKRLRRAVYAYGTPAPVRYVEVDPPYETEMS